MNKVAAVTSTTLEPRFRRAKNRHVGSIWPAKESRRIGRAVEPISPRLAGQNHRHAVVNAGDVSGGIGHDHGIDRTPLRAVSPEASNDKYLLAWEGEPGSRLGSALALRLAEFGNGD